MVAGSNPARGAKKSFSPNGFLNHLYPRSGPDRSVGRAWGWVDESGLVLEFSTWLRRRSASAAAGIPAKRAGCHAALSTLSKRKLSLQADVVVETSARQNMVTHHIFGRWLSPFGSTPFAKQFRVAADYRPCRDPVEMSRGFSLVAKGVHVIKRRALRFGAKPLGGLNRVYLAVAHDRDGEGVYAVTGPSGERLPLLAIDQPGLAALSAYAQHLANSSRKTVSIICFTERSHHETFQPLTTGDKGSS